MSLTGLTVLVWAHITARTGSAADGGPYQPATYGSFRHVVLIVIVGFILMASKGETAAVLILSTFLMIALLDAVANEVRSMHPVFEPGRSLFSHQPHVLGIPVL